MITFDNIAKYYGGEALFEGVSLALHDRERTGLIGVNGSGKTTVLRLLAGKEPLDRGSIGKPSGFTIGYLPQEVELLDRQTPLEIVLEPFAHLLDYEKKLQELGENAHDADALRRLAELHHEVEFHDVYSLQSRAEAILSGLGVPRDKWNGPLTALSGGYRMRWCSAGSCFFPRIFCFWTNRPTTSIWTRWSGSKNFWAATRAAC